MTTLEDIKKYMINYLSNHKGNGNDYYDDDGYCGNKTFRQIMKFWENFNTNDNFKYLVSCEWVSDDMNLNGGRNYFLTSSNVLSLVFDYMINTLKWDRNKYESIICDSNEFTDYLCLMFEKDGHINRNYVDIISTPSDEIKEIPNIKNNEDYYYIPKFVKYPNFMKEFLNKSDSLKFVSNSLIDESKIIYEIKHLECKIPIGFEVVLPISEYI